MPRNISQVVLSKIEQYWSEKDPSLILKILHRYGEEEYERESPRFQLAIIKLSAGDLNRLEKHVDLAKKDYRDVLAFAEYPEEMRMGFLGMRELSEEEAKAIRQRDREQYLAWLEG
jgi:hypothetical protein